MKRDFQRIIGRIRRDKNVCRENAQHGNSIARHSMEKDRVFRAQGTKIMLTLCQNTAHSGGLYFTTQ